MAQKYYIYQHAGSGNHGCEALARTVISLIQELDGDSEICLVSNNPTEDEKYGFRKIQGLQLTELNKCVKRWNLNWMKIQISKLLHSGNLRMHASFHTEWMKHDDAVYIAIGGDNYCYDKGKAFYQIDDAIAGRKILLGCSIEPLDLDSVLTEHLKQFRLITARETVTLGALRDAGLTNVVLAPDTAFNLPAAEVERGTEDYVGINISPMILNYAGDPEAVLENYRHLIREILRSTDYSIMFVPHVVSAGNDDRLAIRNLLESVEIPSERCLVVDDQDCMKLKGWIGQCDFFIGARTHSTIAAYSQCIPTLVMGYSVKSVGIAVDLFGDSERYVIPVNSLTASGELLASFQWMMEEQDRIRKTLREKIPEKRKQIWEVYRSVFSTGE